MTLSETTSLLMGLGSIIAATIGWSIWATWWLSKQFSQTRRLVWDKAEVLQTALEAKLEYHERHDDQRFAQIMNDIWAIRVRNALRDGETIEPRQEWPKRANSLMSDSSAGR